MLKFPRTKAEAIAHLKAKGLMPSWTYLCVQAALKDWNKYRG